MDLLVQWVTQILIFLLLATIIDLLIPATTMKKYIKLVIGLILILIFLKPIFFLFNVDIQNVMETSISQLYEQETDDNSMEKLIEIQKKDIQASQDAYILEEMVVQLKNLAKTPLLENFQVEISDIHFRFLDEKKVVYEELEEIIVYLYKSNHQKGVTSVVDEVKINTDDPIVKDEEKNSEQIKILLQDIWELENKKLTIKWGGGAS